MHTKFKKWVILIIAFWSINSTNAQIDTTRPTLGSGLRPQIQPSSPKPYNEIITAKAKTDLGLFKVHKVDEKYFFEIPDSLLKREILIVNRVSKAPSGARSGPLSYSGDQLSQKVIRFEKGPNNKIFLRTISFAEYAKDSSAPMFTAVSNSNMQPIAVAFDIKAFSKDSMSSVIDVTDFINGDNDILFLSSSIKSSARIGAIQADKSYVVKVNSHPVNIEVTAVKTYSLSGAGGGSILGMSLSSQGGNITVELNSSMVVLPKEPMQARYFDPRVGYFTVGYTDFDLNPQGIKSIEMIKRWRLEPKEEDVEKYKKGELVEPKNPIIYYIDPATPEKWIPYLIQGVSDWQKAFEKAGFKNAIFGKRAPSKKEDPEWSLEDARHGAIVYKPSSVANASGPSISDPRSGEIMESHINWFHNVMSLVRNWYFIQASPIDPRARKMVFDDELMGQLIRFVSSHEVGHTLGLRHNFGSSSSVPVENLRNKAWLEANGHTPSIMDYARFNYVAQPEDNVGDKGIFPRIGDYDDWAINWGYRRFYEYNSPEAEKSSLNKWVIENLKNKRLWFGDGESNRDDPRNLTEQVGDDAVKGSMYGIKNLQRIIPNLIDWTKEPSAGYDNLETIYDGVVSQFNRYNNHVIALIGGILKTPKMVEESGPIYEIASKSKQKEAINHLNKYVFNTPSWLINKEIFDKTGENGLKVIGNIQDGALSGILKRNKLNHLVQAETISNSKEYYSISELLKDLKKGVWTELSNGNTIDIYRRQLQQLYVDRLDKLLNPKEAKLPTDLLGLLLFAAAQSDPDLVDVNSTLRAHLTSLKSEINATANKSNDEKSKMHLKDMSRRIEDSLNPKK